MMNRRARLGPGTLWFPCLAVLITAAAPLCAHQLTPVRGTTPAAVFACQDTIAVHVSFDPRPDSAQDLVAEWQNTSTNLHHTTRIVVEPQQAQAWVWMSYEPPAGSRLNPLADGGGYGDFAGKWKVQLFLNSRAIADTEFSVQC